MSKGIRPEDLGATIQQELEIYSEGIVEKVNAAGKTAAERLKKLTKASAPKNTGSFRKNIAVKEQPRPNGMKEFVWHVKAPDYRITHLLVHGHANRDGSRTPGDPFLQKALDTVLPEYEKEVEEALK